MVQGQQRACMPLYIGKSRDLVRCYRCLTHWQTSEYRATQLVSSIKFKLSHATAIFETSQFFTLLPKLDTIQNDAYNRLLKMSMWWSCQGRVMPCRAWTIWSLIRRDTQERDREDNGLFHSRDTSTIPMIQCTYLGFACYAVWHYLYRLALRW